MKNALCHTGIPVFTNFRKRKTSKKNKKSPRSFTFKLIFFLVSITTFHCFSNTTIPIVGFQKNTQNNYYKPDSLGIPKTIQSSKSELDTDKDGVIDILDLDDDNDGILDNDEGFYNLNSLRGKSIVITINGAWVLVFTSVYFELPLDLNHGDEFWVPFLGKQYVKAVRIRFENTENGIKFIQTAAKHTIGDNPELDTELDYDFDNGGIVSPIALSDDGEGYGIASIEYQEKIIISEYLGTSGKVLIGPKLDTDNDGLIDSRDTDSDNDGCPDVSEVNSNLTATETLKDGSNGGSSGNLGTSSNLNGIPIPLGTINGNENIGQDNFIASVTSEQLTVSELTNVTAKIGDNISINVTATAVKTATFNLGVPNYTDLYGTDTSDLIEYKWYRNDDLKTIVYTSKTLTINNINIDKSGVYVVKVKSAWNSCAVEKVVFMTVDGVLGGIENFDKEVNSFKVYPNPSQGDISLLLSSKESVEAKITLYDISGKEIFSVPQKLSAGKNEIDFNVNVKSGIYFLKVVNKQINYGVTKIMFK